jgi:pimeloyl-ACP methyl ester carboxylesterase
VIYGSELAGCHTLMPDFLGFGYSEQPETFGYTVDEQVDSLAFFLDKVQASQCTVIGHSSGGAVAIALATKRPDLVARLVLAEGDLNASNWFDCATQS